MKRNIITALLITAMISTMTACGNKNTDTTTETVTTTEIATEETATTEIATQDQIATLPLTDEEKPVVVTTPSPDPKTTDAPKTTEDPKASAKPVVTAKPATTATAKPEAQASNTTAKPSETEKPSATAVPKSTETPKNTVAPTTAPVVTATPVATATPKATQTPTATVTPAATPAPTATPVACQHTNTHVESSHDTYEVPISGGCYEVWCTATRVCNDCGANLGEAPEKVNEVHTNVVHKEGVSATCTTDGYSAVYGCDCGSQPEVGGDVIPAFGHDYHDEFDREETDAEGKDHVYFHSICRNCGDISSVWEE